MIRADALAWPPRGLSREQAARYIGVGTTKFDGLVQTGLMPRAKRIDEYLVWDRLAIEAAAPDVARLAAHAGLTDLGVIYVMLIRLTQTNAEPARC